MAGMVVTVVVPVVVYKVRHAAAISNEVANA